MVDTGPHADDLLNHRLATLNNAARAIGPRALEILVSIAERLERGAKTYGGDFDDKPRKWVAEALEENLDGIVYLTMALKEVKEQAEADKARQRAATRDKYLPTHEGNAIAEMGV